MSEDKYVTIAEVCEELKIHPQTVRRWIKQDGLPAIQIGGRTGYRIRRADLEAFIESRETGKAAPLAA
jgi:excisionase family DNA binding protein